VTNNRSRKNLSRNSREAVGRPNDSPTAGKVPIDSPSPARPEDGDFGSTRWSIVLTAGQASSPDSREALAILCRAYWYPLYAYVRRRTSNVHEAQDMIQEFFTRLLQKNVIATATPHRGRFRSFLLTSLRNFMANEWAKSKASKRGGNVETWSIDLETAESRYLRELADALTPEKLFERRWAETLLDRATLQLRDEYVRAGKEPHFDELKIFLTGRNAAVSAAEVAARLRLTEGAVMVAAHRMRRRFRDILLAAIGETLTDPKDLDDEINRLFAALGPD
jgi:RNA polymerase sigma-70 factor (ECF subfamily)